MIIDPIAVTEYDKFLQQW